MVLLNIFFNLLSFIIYFHFILFFGRRKIGNDGGWGNRDDVNNKMAVFLHVGALKGSAYLN